MGERAEVTELVSSVEVMPDAAVGTLERTTSLALKKQSPISFLGGLAKSCFEQHVGRAEGENQRNPRVWAMQTNMLLGRRVNKGSFSLSSYSWFALFVYSH